MTRGTLILIVAATVGAVAWWRTDNPPVPIHVVVVTLDTTRADRLSPYGFMDAAMPALERLAREGVLFDQAVTVAPLTLPAHASLFTGLYPPRHGVRDNADRALAASHTTLAEVLRAHDYCTGAFVSSIVLDADRGLAQGFDVYQGVPVDRDGHGPPQRRADAVIDDAVTWLAGGQSCPLFLWAHLYDAHRPYDPPEPYRSRHADPYVGEIAFAEAQVAKLLEALERRRLLEHTLVVVAADHGESLGEHGEENHGLGLYESVIRVPLFIRLPPHLALPAAAGSRVGDVVRLIDVMPTVLDVLGFEAPPADGVSLTSVMAGRRLDLDAYAESMYPARFGQSPRRALRDRRFKLIDGPRPEMYDLARDPFEERNVHAERRTVADVMSRRLSLLDRLAQPIRGPVLSDVPPELGERLRALGYTTGNHLHP